MIISFSYTLNALLAGAKTCSRRRWSDMHHERWVRAWRQGRHIHQAWDKLPFAGGSMVGRIRLTCDIEGALLKLAGLESETNDSTK